MSGKPGDAVAVRALRAGAAAYLRKDMAGGALLAETLRRTVETDQSRRAIEQRQQQINHQLLELERRHQGYQRECEELAQSVYTPLAAIQEFVSLVLDGVSGPVSELQGKYLAYARGCCRQLQRSVEARIVGERLAFTGTRRQWCDIATLLEPAVASFAGDARVREVPIDCRVEAGLPQVRLDPHEFQQVLVNLLNHALNARQEGCAVLVRVERGRSSAEGIVVTISATGSAPQEGPVNAELETAPLPEIFTKGQLPYRGSLQRRLAIQLRSRPERLELREPQRKDQFMGTAANLLIVDDDAPILRALTARLEHTGYSVKAASNASIALTSLDEQKPDVALLDIDMPGLDGFKLAEELHRRVPECRCIFLTASKRQEHREQARAMDLRFVEKPFDARDLLDAIEDARRERGL